MSMMMRRRGDEGASLVIAVLFVGAIGLWATAVVSLAFPNLATTPIERTNRGLNYDADAAMAQDIATIRYANLGTPAAPQWSGVPGSCPQLNYPTASPTMRVVCTALATGMLFQRHVQLQVYKTSDGTPLATAEVFYFDDGSWGRAAYVSNWSAR